MSEPWHWILQNPRAVLRMVAMAAGAYYFYKVWNEEGDDDEGGGGLRILKFLGLADEDETKQTRPPSRPSPAPHLP